MIRTSQPHPNRSGFTLLEVLLASVIALLLMAALYSAMETHLHYAQSGRAGVDCPMGCSVGHRCVGLELNNKFHTLALLFYPLVSAQEYVTFATLYDSTRITFITDLSDVFHRYSHSSLIPESFCKVHLFG